MILSLDPGNKQTAFCFLDERTGMPGADVKNGGKGILLNQDLSAMLRAMVGKNLYDVLAIENMQSFGMPVGREVFETCVWIGRFVQMCKAPLIWPVYRTQVKARFCPTMPNDKGVRRAMCARYNGNPDSPKQTGVLAGVKADIWSAVAIGTFVYDLRREGVKPPREEAFLMKASGFSRD